MSQEANPNPDKTSKEERGTKYLVYADLLPKLQRISELGYKEHGGLGWAVNFIIRQFSDDAIAMLERTVTEVAHFKFWMNGCQWEIKVSAPKDSEEARMGIQIDPRSIFNSQMLPQKSQIHSVVSPVSSFESFEAPNVPPADDPFSIAMQDVLQ